MNPELVELIVECIDALKVPAFDPEHRGEHLRRLANAVSRPDISPVLHRLLSEASRGIATLEGMHVMDPRPKWIEQVAVALEDELKRGGQPRLLYHGTIRGRVESIQVKGLIPGAMPVWKDRKDLRSRSDGAVFFSETWRGAASWASAAHSRSRGPREGAFRKPVVIRVPVTDREIMPDNLARAPGCWAITGSVSVAHGHLFEGPLEGFPVWTALSDLTPSRLRLP